MPIPDRLPTFDELPSVPGAPPQSAWGLFREFFFTSAPRNKLGGVGSPPNAIAFK